MGKEILKMENVTYYYPAKSGNVEILENVDYCFETGKLYTVMGPSGSGKTTTLSLLEGLDVPKEGKVLFEGKDISQINGNLYRGQHIGIIFQSYNLFPYLNARENVEVSMETSGKREKKKEKACELLRKMGLKEEQYGRGIEQLSGGEQQRVALPSCPAGRSSVWPLPAPWSITPRFCWQTSLRGIWTRIRRKRSGIYLQISLMRWGNV